MKKNPKRKKVKKLKSKKKKKKKLKKRKRKKSKKLPMNTKSKINPNLFGWENLNPLPKKNMLLFTNHYPMIGKTTCPSNNSLLKVNLNSKLSSMSLKELLSIYSKLRKREITSNSMLEESSLWMIVKNWSLITSLSLKVLLIPKIYHWIFPENSYNKIKSWKLLRKTWLRKLWNWSPKLLKTMKIIRNSMNNSPKISN